MKVVPTSLMNQIMSFLFEYYLQVREMNLLRESNMQLREENKHNFEECQVLVIYVMFVFY